MSPDGRSAYVMSDEFRGITALVSFARKSDGRLVQLAGRAGCLRLIARDGCGVLPPGTLRDIVMSPDGRFLYAAVGHYGESPHDGSSSWRATHPPESSDHSQDPLAA